MPLCPDGKHIQTFLCNCKFQNELNNSRLDMIYKDIVNRLKHLSNKNRDKEYLLMMEQFNKKIYESCDKCSYREYSNNLIALSRPLQNDFKNISNKY